MNKNATFQFIAERQRHWAAARSLTVTSNGRVSQLEDNLFAPLHVETRAEFEAGDGDEFGKPDDVGKMFSLHSSSALVCNVFDYWRRRSLLPLLRACEVDTAGTDLRFEQKFLTGVGSKPANLDVLITSSGAEYLPIAVESKFTEPFQTGERDSLRPSYLNKTKVWDGLPNCQRIAKSLGTKDGFECLKAGQLLKHVLALKRKFGQRRFMLLYLWYDVNGSDAANQHRNEVREFAKLLGDEVLFRGETYQNIFNRLSSLTSGSPYELYLRSRYFA